MEEKETIARSFSEEKNKSCFKFFEEGFCKIII
jgi:hypothetical protein